MRTATIHRVKMPDGLWQWCLRWQTELMPSMAFWYFDTLAEAEAAKLRVLHRVVAC